MAGRNANIRPTSRATGGGLGRTNLSDMGSPPFQNRTNGRDEVRDVGFGAYDRPENLEEEEDEEGEENEMENERPPPSNPKRGRSKKDMADQIRDLEEQIKRSRPNEGGKRVEKAKKKVDEPEWGSEKYPFESSKKTGRIRESIRFIAHESMLSHTMDARFQAVDSELLQYMCEHFQVDSWVDEDGEVGMPETEDQVELSNAWEKWMKEECRSIFVNVRGQYQQKFKTAFLAAHNINRSKLPKVCTLQSTPKKFASC
jgi:hypothetical protein